MNPAAHNPETIVVGIVCVLASLGFAKTGVNCWQWRSSGKQIRVSYEGTVVIAHFKSEATRFADTFFFDLSSDAKENQKQVKTLIQWLAHYLAWSETVAQKNLDAPMLAA